MTDLTNALAELAAVRAPFLEELDEIGAAARGMKASFSANFVPDCAVALSKTCSLAWNAELQQVVVSLYRGPYGKPFFECKAALRLQIGMRGLERLARRAIEASKERKNE